MTNYINIAKHTTFGVPAFVKAFHTFQSKEELDLLFTTSQRDAPLLVLGGGSNMLFTQPHDFTVLKNECKGMDIVHEDQDVVFVKAMGGEVWHEFVQYTVAQGWGGIENLSLIPGSVGASPIQNIGAYGVEIKDVFESLEAYEIATGQVRTFKLEECNFGYRESVFKHELKGQFIILSVTYRLQKHPHINTSYGAINDELEAMKIASPTVKDVSDAVIRIRQSKLPDPNEIGNAGSFFKNPVVPISIYEKLKSIHADAPCYPVNEEEVKVPAGWLIERAGWKGYREGDFGVHAKQALVLVNYGNAEGGEIFQLSERIISDIESKFGIRLEREVNIF